uniref:Uncharacterized protein n=1 Tax=Strongyloides venezuelensis TaxID=75913 RepID=A0A0K0FTA5_STRVS
MDQYQHIDFKSLDRQDIFARTKRYHCDTTRLARAISTILSEIESNDTTMIQPTVAQRQSYDFCLSVTLFNHRNQTQRVKRFLESLTTAFELDGITQDRVKINVLRQRVEQVTRHLLPPVTVTETFQFYFKKIRNAFPLSFSDTIASNKYYKFMIDMK